MNNVNPEITIYIPPIKYAIYISMHTIADRIITYILESLLFVKNKNTYSVVNAITYARI
jgi:hypothetical protein